MSRQRMAKFRCGWCGKDLTGRRKNWLEIGGGHVVPFCHPGEYFGKDCATTYCYSSGTMYPEGEPPSDDDSPLPKEKGE